MEASLIKRLEDAVQRLERLGGTTAAPVAASAVPAPASSAVARAAPAPPAPSSAPASAAPAPASNNASAATILADFDQILTSRIPSLTHLTSSLDQQVQEAVSLYSKAYQETRALIDKASRTPNPGMAGLQPLLQPIAQHMMALGKMTEGRRTAAFNHVKTLAEAVQSLSWLAFTGPDCGLNPPPQHVTDSWQTAEFYANKLRMESRAAGAPPGAVEAAIAWVKAVKDINTDLETIVTKYFADGLRWNYAAGGAPSPAAPATPAAPAAAAKRAGPPPPPPPGPPPKALSVSTLQDSAGKAGGASGAAPQGMSALFKELQQGTDITKGLKKVTDDMKTKNRTDRTGFVSIPVKDKLLPTTSTGGGAKPMGPARCEYDSDRKKWVVENQVGRRDLVLDAVTPQQGLYIYNCKDCVIHVPHKANAISVDSCAKTGIMFSDVICQVEVINSRSLQLQCTGYVPTVSVEKTDGVQIYVNKAITTKEDFQVVTAKCSEVNVHVLPDPNDENDDLREHAIPEQFISTFDKTGNLVTHAAAHSGA